MTIKPIFIALALVSFSASSWAQITLSGSQTDDAIIPDDDLGGIAETMNLGSSIQSITGVQVTLDIGGTANYQPWNGDYYAYLENGSGFAILLNRVGTTSAANPNDFGYGDTGMDVTFSDTGSDIHNYQSGPYTLNSAGQLTGTWAPDGRNVSPFTVTSADPQTAMLGSFDGESSAGDWTLFIADCSPGGIGNLDSWSLQVEGVPAVPGVPDNASTAKMLGIVGALLALASMLLRRQSACR